MLELNNNVSNIKSDIEFLLEAERNSLTDEQIKDYKKSITNEATLLAFAMIQKMNDIKNDVAILKTNVNVCETRLDYAEEEIKKFTYERRKLNIGG